jgi:hypothetical protein
MNFGGLTFMSTSTPAAFNSATKTWTAGDLAAGATATIKIVYKATTAGTYAPSASAATTATESSTTNNMSHSTIAVTAVVTPPPEPTGPLGWLRSRLWFLSSSTRRIR